MDEVFGRTLRLTPGYVDGQYPQTLLVFTHEEIRNSTIVIHSVSSDRVELKWNATCDVNFNDEYGGTELDLSIETHASLKYSDRGFESGVKLEVID